MPEIENLPKDAAKGLGRKVGPFPLWGWVVIVGGSGLVVYWVFFRESASGSATAARSLLPTLGGATYSGGGSGGSGGTTGSATGSATGGTFGADTPVTGGTAPYVTTPTVDTKAGIKTNAEWLNRALEGVPQTLVGVNPALIRLYLEQYLQGQRPIGSNQAVTLFDRIVRSAVEYAGQIPNPPGVPTGSTNPYASNLSWLQNALGFAPGTTSGAARQELISLINGTTTEISQEAADLLDLLRNTLGYEPQGLSYKIKSAVPTPSIPTIPTVQPPAPAAPLPFVRVTIDQIKSLFSLANQIPAGQNPNTPAVYTPIWRAAFGDVPDNALQAAVFKVQNLWRSGTVNNQTPAPLLEQYYLDAVNQAFKEVGYRQVQAAT